MPRITVPAADIELAEGEVWVGYMDEGAWRYASADPCGVEVTHWAELPEPTK